jgi:probable rRNA maturation factor
MRSRPPERGAGRLRVTVTDAKGASLRDSASSGLSAWLNRAAPRQARGHVSLAVVSDAFMRSLNRKYRGIDRPTDVLSFPAEAGGRGSEGANALGDLAIARGVAGRQARALGHSLRTEIRVLALHGLLHLLGYDHEVDRGQMAKLERHLLRRAGLNAGLIGRHRPRPGHR